MIFCSLYSGSSGNSLFVSSDNAKVLVDAGLSGKHIENALLNIGHNTKDIDAIFVTHEHIDHTKGVGVLSRKYDIPIYANAPTWQAMSATIGKIKEHNIKIIENNYVNIKDIDVLSYKISHDAVAPSGYALQNKNKKVCIATDLGFFSDDVNNSIKDADVILLESNHDVEMLKFGPYPYKLKRRILSDIGHLSNEDCGKAIVNITNDKFKKIILGHLSKTNNYPELAYQTVLNVLNSANVKLDKDLSLSMAKRDIPSNYIEF
ncbi:MBL fold metallo-hydrolase [Clostridium thailandense]|uniref:MBL fold metallo-hydrolase n=1 Tax=Clostridium thailandense TaxID=2794346 RepID=A0A949TJ72_9CLOT|nr:MBL fold metallo-hydrolase [Clostridium thailandense]MBV7273285.1 MBL fold metallo-hydrolase [Clostridium thailandense]MCH5137310.1 MBL fold metallo-hydrolase [Clostridiaceae bacterium UIB06]